MPAGAAPPLPDPPAFDPVAPALPTRQILIQRWSDLAFLHWRVDPDRIAPLLPAGTAPDLHDGSSWVGLVCFRMVGAGLGRGPPIPWLGTFPETNVRLYSIDRTGRRGVVFRSLAAPRLAVVLASRAGFGLPYTWARMRIRRRADDLEYASIRRWPAPRGAGGRVVLRPGEPLERPDALAEFLTARWGLHTRYAGRTLYVPNWHPPWLLQAATLLHLDDTLVAAAGIPGVVEQPPDSVLYSAGVPTVFGWPYDARRPGASGDVLRDA